MNPWRYCGEYFDKETGNIYLRARYYSPVLGRFTQEDPIGDGLNWYTYCDNNPVMFADSSGLAMEPSEWAEEFTYQISSDNTSTAYSLISTLGSATAEAMVSALPAVIAGITTALVSVKASIATIWNPVAFATTATIAVVALTTVYVAVKTLEIAKETVIDWAHTKAITDPIDKEKFTDYSVYGILHQTEQKIYYVGITNDPGRRWREHKSPSQPLNSNRKKLVFPEETYDLRVLKTGSSKKEARAMEHILITAFTLDALQNSINSIAKGKIGEFQTEINRMESLISGYVFD